MVERKGIFLLGGVAGVIAVVGLIAYFGTAHTSSSPGNLPNPYVNRAYAFSLQYPDDWKGYENYKLDANTTSIVTFFGKNSSISVIARPISAGQTLDAFEAQSKQALLAQHRDNSLELLSEGSGVVSHVPAHVRVWHRETPQGSYQEETIHLIYRGYLYSVGFVAPTGSYNTDISAFNQVLRTFTFY